MEGIWIIIFVAVMIFQVYQKIMEGRTKLPQDRESEELPQEFREVRFPWETDDETEHVGFGHEPPREPENYAPAQEAPWADKFGIAKTKTQSKRGQSKRSHKQEDGKVHQEQSMAGEPLPLMDSHNLVNAFIMSELLQPPKSKRRRAKPL